MKQKLTLTIDMDSFVEALEKELPKYIKDNVAYLIEEQLEQMDMRPLRKAVQKALEGYIHAKMKDPKFIARLAGKKIANL